MCRADAADDRRRRRPRGRRVAAAALAFAAVGITPTLLLGLAPRPAAAQVPAPEPATPPETAEQRAKRLAFANDAGPALSVQADPVFAGMAGGGTWPLVVQVKNRSGATRARITVEAVGYSSSTLRRTYAREVELPGGGAVSRFRLYPELPDYSYAQFRVRVETPRNAASDTVFASYADRRQVVGYVGDRFGALSFRPSYTAYKAVRDSRREAGYKTMPDGARFDDPSGRPPGYADTPDYFAAFNACYAKPENAPDRAAGYANLSNLVIGEGAERLSAAQWKAIREWVKSGGSVILIGAAGEAGTFRGITDLSPAHRDIDLCRVPSTRDLRELEPQSSQRSGLTLPNDVAGVDYALPGPGAESLWTYTVGGEPHTFLARKHVGFGTVLYVGFDPTQEPFRNWYRLPTLWQGLLKRAAPLADSGTVASAAQQQSFDNNPASAPGGTNDPFRVTLPPLKPIVFLFLGYFVLAIPVTFVVLKRTRRMNLAWVTGPTLAVGVAGLLYLFTADLYRAPLSRRTSGLLLAAEGDPEARFVGQTELFFPRAGNYDVSVPGAERIELTAGEDYNRRSSATVRTLESGDDGSQVTHPRLAVANLSFRRVYHEQRISLGGGGITARVTVRPDSTITYEVRNDTGLTLTDVNIAVPNVRIGADLIVGEPGTPEEIASRGRGFGRSVPVRNIVIASSLAPHAVARGEKPATGEMALWRDGQQQIAINAARADLPILTARTDGAGLGPSLGTWAGGAGSVEVAMPLAKPEGGR